MSDMPSELEAEVAARKFAEAVIMQLLADTQQPLAINEILRRLAEPERVQQIFRDSERVQEIFRRSEPSLRLEDLRPIWENIARRAILRLAASGRAAVDTDFKLSPARAA